MSHTLGSGAAYDAVSLLGFGDAVAEALPTASPGEVVLRYGGWSLRMLHDRCGLLWRQDWYDGYPWSEERLPSGIYVVRVPVPGSDRKTFGEQRGLLLSSEEPAPIVLAASALLAIRLSGGSDPLKGGWTRCREESRFEYHVGLDWHKDRLYVGYDWDGDRANVWLVSARRIV